MTCSDKWKYVHIKSQVLQLGLIIYTIKVLQ